MTEIIKELTDALIASAQDLKSNISDVKMGEIIDGEESIKFSISGVEYIGMMRGRNRHLCLGFGKDCDRRIAFRVLVDGDAKPLTDLNK